MEISSNTSPKYRSGYRVVDNFDRLSIDEVVSIFSYIWVVCVPFFEIDVNITIEHFMCMVILVDDVLGFDLRHCG